MSKCTEIVKEFFDHEASIDYSTWDARVRAAKAVNAALEWAAQQCERPPGIAVFCHEDSARVHADRIREGMSGIRGTVVYK